MSVEIGYQDEAYKNYRKTKDTIYLEYLTFGNNKSNFLSDEQKNTVRNAHANFFRDFPLNEYNLTTYSTKIMPADMVNNIVGTINLDKRPAMKALVEEAKSKIFDLQDYRQNIHYIWIPIYRFNSADKISNSSYLSIFKEKVFKKNITAKNLSYSEIEEMFSETERKIWTRLKQNFPDSYKSSPSIMRWIDNYEATRATSSEPFFSIDKLPNITSGQIVDNSIRDAGVKRISNSYSKNLKEALSSKFIIFKSNSQDIGYRSTFFVFDLPNSSFLNKMTFLDKTRFKTGSGVSINTSINATTKPMKEALEIAQKKEKFIKGSVDDVSNVNTKNALTTKVAKALFDNKRFQKKALSSPNDSVHSYTLTVTVVADSEIKLQDTLNELTRSYESINAQVYFPTGLELADNYKNFIPGGTINIPSRALVNITNTLGIASQIPFTKSNLFFNKGMYFGENRTLATSQPFNFDFDELATMETGLGMLLLGDLGEGKSFTDKYFSALNLSKGIGEDIPLENQTQFIVVDPTPKEERIRFALYFKKFLLKRGIKNINIAYVNPAKPKFTLDPIISAFKYREEDHLDNLEFNDLLEEACSDMRSLLFHMFDLGTNNPEAEPIMRTLTSTYLLEKELKSFKQWVEHFANATKHEDEKTKKLGSAVQLIFTTNKFYKAVMDESLPIIPKNFHYLSFSTKDLTVPTDLNKKTGLTEAEMAGSFYYNLIAVMVKNVSFRNPNQLSITSYEEAIAFLSSPIAEAVLIKQLTQSRANKAALILIVQALEIAEKYKKLIGLIGTVFAFATKTEDLAEEQCKILGVPEERKEFVKKLFLNGLSPKGGDGKTLRNYKGQAVVKDPNKNLGVVKINIINDPDLLNALNSSSGDSKSKLQTIEEIELEIQDFENSLNRSKHSQREKVS